MVLGILRETPERAFDALVKAYPEPKSIVQLSDRLGLTVEKTQKLYDALFLRGWASKTSNDEYYLQDFNVKNAGNELHVLPQFLRWAESTAVKALLRNRGILADLAATQFYLNCVKEYNKRHTVWWSANPEHKDAILFFSGASSIYVSLTALDDKADVNWAGNVTKSTAKTLENLGTSVKASKDSIRVAYDVRLAHPDDWEAFRLKALAAKFC